MSENNELKYAVVPKNNAYTICYNNLPSNQTLIALCKTISKTVISLFTDLSGIDGMRDTLKKAVIPVVRELDVILFSIMAGSAPPSVSKNNTISFYFTDSSHAVLQHAGNKDDLLSDMLISSVHAISYLYTLLYGDIDALMQVGEICSIWSDFALS